MLKVQATACGSETTSASARSFAISARMRVELGARRLRRRSADRAATTAPERRRRAVGPDRVDRIGLDRHQRRAGVGAGLARASRRRRRCAARGRSRACAPAAGSASSHCSGGVSAIVHDREHRGVDLVARLQRVAAVDEQRGAVGQHDRGAGRAGEAGQPGQPLLGRRHVFVLMAVGARHDEAGEPAPRRVRRAAPRRAARSAPRSRIVERLESGLEHARQSMGGAGRGNCAADRRGRLRRVMCIAT